MARTRVLVSLFGALALVGVLAAPAGAAPPDTQAAVDFLDAEQVPGNDPADGDGSWDEDFGFGISEFNTTEAVLAIASVAQPGGGWDPTGARLAVEGTLNGDGLDPLAFLDLWAEGAIGPGQAAKLLLLAALPLADGSAGFDPFAWDPAGDGDPVDLVVALGAGPDGCDDVADFGFFGQTTVAMQAVAVLCGRAGPAATQTVLDAQQADGGWSFDGDPSGVTDPDVDVTGMALMALVAGGLPGDHPAVLDGLRFLAERQEPEGWWGSPFDPASPESTSRAILGITAAGWDVGSPAWRDFVLPEVAGSPYVSPDDALGALQRPDGSIASDDTFGPVLSTAQALQAVERNWLPVAVTEAPVIDEPVVEPVVEPDEVPLGEPFVPLAPPATPEPAQTLPFTGPTDVVPLALAGVALVVAGAALRAGAGARRARA